jgi:hypothetical protein
VSLQEKIEDLKTKIKTDRRYMAAAGLVVVVLLLWVFTSSGSKRGSSSRMRGSTVAYDNEQQGNPGLANSEAAGDLVSAFQERQKELENLVREQQASLERLEKEHKQQQEKTAGVLDIVAERLERQDDDLKRMESTTQTTSDSTSASGGTAQGAAAYAGGAPEPDAVEPFGFNAVNVPPPPQAPVIERRSFISPGDSAQVVLLTGVAAPTDGTPYPVVFKLDGPVTGPDGSALDLGEARIIAAAQGSETDARVVYRMTDLSFRHKDGRRSVVKVDGWVVGEDGIRGMKGQVIDKLGQVIAATAGYSFIAALGDNVDRRRRFGLNDLNRSGSVNITSGDLNGATASAATDASNRLGQMLLDKYEKMVPVVEVASGRAVGAVFAKGAEVSVIDDEEDEDGQTGGIASVSNQLD